MRLVCYRDVFPPMLPEGLAGGIGGMRTEAPLVVTMTMEMHGGVVALGHSFIEDGLIGHEEVLDTRKLWTRVIDYATVACSPCLQHANMRLVCYRDVFPPTLLERGLAGGIGGMRTEAPFVVTMTMEMHGGGVAQGHSFFEYGLIGHEEVLDTRKFWTRVIDYATVACSLCLGQACERAFGVLSGCFPPYATRARSRRWHWWSAY